MFRPPVAYHSGGNASCEWFRVDGSTPSVILDALAPPEKPQIGIAKDNRAVNAEQGRPNLVVVSNSNNRKSWRISSNTSGPMMQPQHHNDVGNNEDEWKEYTVHDETTVADALLILPGALLGRTVSCHHVEARSFLYPRWRRSFIL